MSKDWRPTGWWRVVDPNGGLWSESSDEQENRECMRPGDTLHREEEVVVRRWVEIDPLEIDPLNIIST